MKKHGYATPIEKSSCEHKLPLQYGDAFEVETSFQPVDAAKLIFKLLLSDKKEAIKNGFLNNNVN